MNWAGVGPQYSYRLGRTFLLFLTATFIITKMCWLKNHEVAAPYVAGIEATQYFKGAVGINFA
jgi:hypothetical protein